MSTIDSPFDAFSRMFQPPSERLRSAVSESVAAHNRATAGLMQGLATAAYEPPKVFGLLRDYCGAAGERALRLNEAVIDEWRNANVASPAPEGATPQPSQPAPVGHASVASSALESATPQPSESEPMAYCVRCKAKCVVADPVMTTMKNGRAALKGRCSVCGSGVFKIGG